MDDGSPQVEEEEQGTVKVPFRRVKHYQEDREDLKDGFKAERKMRYFRSLLLLLGLMALAMARTTVPQSSRCPSTEENGFPQMVNISSHSISSHTTNFRKITDYSNRSTSPWNLRPNEDPERYPRVIWEAQCRSLNCVNHAGKANLHMNSVGIQQEIMVLKRDSRHCPHSFRLERIMVTVGCTCIRPIIKHLS
ncbi:interleukin-17A [Tenrec ecaudatus]|uniref:interleukin-17A n=1 Tax=Tenrec ecaudatus TaxID=94439 RepID=UPI003F5A2BD3